MAWVGVVTNAGAALLAQWAGGGTLTILSAKTGTGTVAEANLRIQTAVSGEKQTASIVSSSAASQNRKIKVQVPSFTESYTMKQIGIFAKLDSGSSTLLALYQNTDGVNIPDSTSSPDFVYSFFANIAMSNSGTISITIDPSAYVSESTFSAHADSTGNPHAVTYDQVGAAAEDHDHVWADITDHPTSLPASDVYSWAKASSKPSYTYSEVGAAASSHTHTKSQISDFPSSMPASDVYSWAKASSKPSYTYSEVGAAAASHSQGAGTISTGTFPGAVAAGSQAVASSLLRNIYAGTSAMTSGSSSLTTGTIYIQYE